MPILFMLLVVALGILLFLSFWSVLVICIGLGFIYYGLQQFKIAKGWVKWLHPIFGSHSIWEFSLALMIGLVSSIFTSMFMVMQMWYGFKVRELNKHGEIKTVKEKKYKSKKDKLVV